MEYRRIPFGVPRNSANLMPIPTEVLKYESKIKNLSEFCTAEERCWRVNITSLSSEFFWGTTVTLSEKCNYCVHSPSMQIVTVSVYLINTRNELVRSFQIGEIK